VSVFVWLLERFWLRIGCYVIGAGEFWKGVGLSAKICTFNSRFKKQKQNINLRAIAHTSIYVYKYTIEYAQFSPSSFHSLIKISIETGDGR